MNAALGTNIGIGQNGFLAALAMPMANGSAPATPLNQPAFDSMIGMFLGSDLVTATQVTTPSPLATAATPSQIADAMIRSMLGPMSDTMPGTMQVGPGVPPTLDSVAVAAEAPAADPQPAPLTTAKPNEPSPTAVKQPRSIADLPNFTTVVVTPMPPAPLAVMPIAQTGSDPSAVAPKDSNSSAPTPAAPVAPVFKSASEAKVAFTAVLTPIDATVAPDPARQAAKPSLPAPSSSFVAVAAPVAPQPVIAPTGDATPSTALQVTSPAQPPAAGEKSASDTPQHQQDDAPGTPSQPFVMAPAESKIKAAAPKQDDNVATPAIAVRDASAPNVPVSAPASQPPNGAATPATSAAPVPHSAADALRMSESNFTAAPQLRTGAAQEIAIRIAPPDSPTVDLRIVERAGQVHVDVRTSDSGMRTSLRQDLGTLTNSLQKAGYHAETFTPSSTLGRTASSAQSSNQDREDPSQNRNGSGGFSGGKRQQQKRSGNWLEELEEQS